MRKVRQTDRRALRTSWKELLRGLLYGYSLSPKACDPWAVYAAKCSLKSNDKFSALTPLQNRIVDHVKAKGEVTAKDLTEHLGLTEEEFKREFAVLRHMEVLRGKKEETTVLYTLFDS